MAKKYKKPKTKKYRKKAPRKARRKMYTGNIIRISNPKQMIPANAMVCFRQKYCINLDTTFVQPQISGISIKANSLYRPFSAVTSKTGTNSLSGYATTDSPAGFQMYCGNLGMYSFFRVYKAGLTVRTMGEINGGSIRVTIAFNTGSGTYGTYKIASESMLAVSSKDYSNIYDPTNINNTRYISQMFAVPNNVIMTERDYSGTYLADPSLQAQFSVFIQRADGTALASTVPIEFELTQWARLESPQEDNVT